LTRKADGSIREHQFVDNGARGQLSSFSPAKTALFSTVIVPPSAAIGAEWLTARLAHGMIKEKLSHAPRTLEPILVANTHFFMGDKRSPCSLLSDFPC